MQTATDKTKNSTPIFESEICSRCGGTGHFSYNQLTGTRCFKCNGNQKSFTKRGLAAALYLKSLRTVKASELKIGDLIRIDDLMRGKAWFAKITSIKDTHSSKSLQSDGTWLTNRMLAIETETKNSLQMNGVTCSPDSDIVKGFSAEEKKEHIEKALDFQTGLTKSGTPRKR